MEFFAVTIDCFFVFTGLDPRHHNGLYCHPSVFKLSLPASRAFLPTLLSLSEKLTKGYDGHVQGSLTNEFSVLLYSHWRPT